MGEIVGSIDANQPRGNGENANGIYIIDENGRAVFSTDLDGGEGQIGKDESASGFGTGFGYLGFLNPESNVILSPDQLEGLIFDIKGNKEKSNAEKALRIAQIVGSQAERAGLDPSQRSAALTAVWSDFGINLNLDPDSDAARQAGSAYGVRQDENGLIDLAKVTPDGSSGGSTAANLVSAIVKGISGIAIGGGSSGGGSATPSGESGGTADPTLADLAVGEQTNAQKVDDILAAIDSGEVTVKQAAEAFGVSVEEANRIIGEQREIRNPTGTDGTTTTDPTDGTIGTMQQVYGPDGTVYANPQAAVAAGVTDYTNTMPNNSGGSTDAGDGNTGGENNPDNESIADRDARIAAEVQSVIDNAEMDEQAKIDAINGVAESNSMDLGKIATLAGAAIIGAGLGGIFSGSSGGGSGGEGSGTGNNSGGNNTNGGEPSGSNLESIISTVGGLLGAWLGYKAAGDATDAQTDAANRALDIFEENVDIATTGIDETTDTALADVAIGATTARGNITDSSTNARTALVAGGLMARDDITTARDNTTARLLESFGLQKEEINNTAVASSALISAAREKSAAAVMSGYSDAITGVESARDLSNKIIQDSTDSAEEKIDVARAGAVAAQDRGVKAIRSDFQPYLDAGKVTVEGLEKLVNDPEAQRDFILDNPFFDEFANQAERRLLANQAATGRVAAGETSLELRNRLLEFGNQLLDTAITQRQNLVNTGMNASAQVGNAEIIRANAVSGIEQAAGQSLAQLVQTAGINKANITTNAGKDIADLSVGRGKDLATIETTAGRDLASIETARGTNIANLTGSNATQISNNENAAAVNLADITTGTATQVANVYTREGANLANINTGEAAANAELEANRGINKANILTGNAANTADVVMGAGNVAAAGEIAQANSLKTGLLDLTTIALNN